MIEIIKGACPICKGDVKGNPQIKYFCKRCNLLFRKESLIIQKPIENAPKSIVGLSKQQLETKFIVSLKSNRYHKISCHYIKNILSKNLFYFNTEKDAKHNDYSRCICFKKK